MRTCIHVHASIPRVACSCKHCLHAYAALLAFCGTHTDVLLRVVQTAHDVTLWSAAIFVGPICVDEYNAGFADTC